MFTVDQLKCFFKTCRKHYTEGIRLLHASGADTDDLIKLSPKKEFIRHRMSYIKPYVSRRERGVQSYKVICFL